MALYLSIGNELLSTEELIEKNFTGELKRMEAATKGISLLGFPSGKKAKFTPVGLGKPLSIEVREIFTGGLPEPGWLRDKKDLLVTTSHKPITRVAAASRALNLMREEVGRDTYINNVAATDIGTPIIYYSPAMVETSIAVTVDFGFENFSKTVLTTLSKAFQTAATIPVFATKSMFLLAGGIVTGLLADLGKALFEKGPEFIGTGSINFERAGVVESIAGYGVLFADDAPRHVRDAYHCNDTGALVHKQTGEAYAERYPYVIVSLDGSENKAYEKFQRAALSAELLAQFYNLGENRAEPVDVLLQGLQYYNDLRHRRDAEELKARIDKFKGSTEEFEKLKTRHQALLKNILTDELKPD